MFNLNLLSVIASIVIVLSIGLFAKKIKILKKENTKLLNDVIIYITLPVFIFRGIYKAQVEGLFFLISIIAFCATALVVVVAYFIARYFKFDKQLTGTFMLAAGVGNTGYIAYPLLIELLGPKGLVRGIFYDMFGTVFFMLTVGLYICSVFGRHNQKPSIGKQFFSFPPLYGLLLGFVLKPFVVPAVLMRSVDIVADITIGLILVSIGLVLEPAKGIKRYLPTISLTLFLKLLFAPFLVFLAVKAVRLEPLSVTTTVLSASMPTALLTLIFGLKFQLNIEFLSSAIFILTIASIVTVPFVQLILKFV